MTYHTLGKYFGKEPLVRWFYLLSYTMHQLEEFLKKTYFMDQTVLTIIGASYQEKKQVNYRVSLFIL